MMNGEIVCVKQRYKNEEAAILQLMMIRTFSGAHVKPQRVYACENCHGYHLTSRA